MCNIPRTDILLTKATAFTAPLQSEESEWISSEGVFAVALNVDGLTDVSLIAGAEFEGSVVPVSGGVPANNSLGIIGYTPTTSHFKIVVKSPQNWSSQWDDYLITARNVTPAL